MTLRDADQLLLPKVRESVGSLTLRPEDAGTLALALGYARIIDDADNRPEAFDKLGPKLLSALEALGCSPRARARLTGKGVHGGSESQGPLQRLRDTAAR